MSISVQVLYKAPRNTKYVCLVATEDHNQGL